MFAWACERVKDVTNVTDEALWTGKVSREFYSREGEALSRGAWPVAIVEGVGWVGEE